MPELKKVCFYCALVLVVITLLATLIGGSIRHNVAMQLISTSCLVSLILVYLFHQRQCVKRNQPIILSNTLVIGDNDMVMTLFSQHTNSNRKKSSNPAIVEGDNQLLNDSDPKCDESGRCSLQLTSEINE